MTTGRKDTKMTQMHAKVWEFHGVFQQQLALLTQQDGEQYCIPTRLKSIKNNKKQFSRCVHLRMMTMCTESITKKESSVELLCRTGTKQHTKQRTQSRTKKNKSLQLEFGEEITRNDNNEMCEKYHQLWISLEAANQ